MLQSVGSQRLRHNNLATEQHQSSVLVPATKHREKANFWIMLVNSLRTQVGTTQSLMVVLGLGICKILKSWLLKPPVLGQL